ncbi:toll-like receptor 2 [Aplochiton taeniatus]
MVTPDAVTLDLSSNHITVVTDDDLSAHGRLKGLSLRGNGLLSVQSGAFVALVTLEWLDLSDNQLAGLNHTWFHKLGFLRQLNLLGNPYRCLAGGGLFLGLTRLRRLALGGPFLEELRRGDLQGVTQLEELTLHANYLKRYEAGSLGSIWPLAGVSLSLHDPFLYDTKMVSAILQDVTYPETPMVLQDVHLTSDEAMQPFRVTCSKRLRQDPGSLTFRNLSMSDESLVTFLEVMDGSPINFLSLQDVTFTGEGRVAKANWSHLEGLDEFYLVKSRVLDPTKFSSLLDLKFLLQYLRRVSLIDSGVFVMPCMTSHLFINLQYMDQSDNLLSDLTLSESLCDGDGTLKDVRVLNFSGNALKSLSTVSQLVARLAKLTHLDISRNAYSSMPLRCTWPSSLRFLNLSRANLLAVTPCLTSSLEVLDLSHNNLQAFPVALPALRELHLSGNKLLHLPPGGLFPNLDTLTIQSNTLDMFGPAVLGSYNRLQNLQAGQNQYLCSCHFVSFLQTEVRGLVHLTDGPESYVCDSPLELQGRRVDSVRLSVVECHRVLFVSVSCGLLLLLGILLGILLWRLHVLWYLRMTWAWLKAKRRSASQRQRDGTRPLLSYDAFVSYSEQDGGWVEGFLVPELEGSENADAPPLSLCLHKRDFLPGHWIVDNIMNAMESSRRTIFVLSENFVLSDWCRYELDFSHFRLFDGGVEGDAAILVLLEPISKENIPKRFVKLRKFMSSRTYLEWPEEEEKRTEFWENLRSAVRGESEEE